MVRPDFRNFQHPNELYHYGMPRRSGRYPWGSGKRPYQGQRDVFKDHTLKAGTKIYRVAVGEDNVKRDINDKQRSGPTYISYDPTDRTLYKGFYISQLKKQNKNYKDGDPIKEVQYTLEKDLKIAGRDAVRRSIEKNVSQYDLAVSRTNHFLEVCKDELLDNYAHNAGEQTYDEFISELSKNYLKQTMIDLKEGGIDYTYYNKAWSIGFDEATKNKIIDDLKNQGYDAMSDEAGIGGIGGYRKQGVDPVIVFDSSGDVMKYEKYEEIIEGPKYDKDYNFGLKYFEVMNKGKK